MQFPSLRNIQRAKACKKIIIRLQHQSLYILFSLCIAGSATADEKIQFAGFAFLGDEGYIEKNYPYSLAVSKLLNSKQQTLLDAELIHKVDTQTPDLDLNTSDLAQRNYDNSLVLAFALDRETVFQEYLCGDYKLVVELSAQILVVDFDDMSIIGSYPIIVEYIDKLDGPASEEYIGNIIKKMYLGGLEVNMLEQFAKSLNGTDISRKHANNMQVSEVVVMDDASTYLPTKYNGGNLSNFESYVAQSFSAALSKNQRISILPYSRGYTIGNKMAARFADGSVYNLTIPESDYAVRITIPKFRKVMYDQKSHGTSWVYGSYAQFEVYEPLSGKVYFNGSIKNGETRRVANCQRENTEWPYYEGSMLVLFDEFTHQIETREKSWTKSHSSTKNLKKQLKALERIVSACR